MKSIIGLFQTYNEKAGKVEWSMTRVQMAIFTLFAMAFLWFFFIEKGNDVNMNNILLTLLLLLTAVAPKAVKDLSDKVKMGK